MTEWLPAVRVLHVLAAVFAWRAFSVPVPFGFV